MQIGIKIYEGNHEFSFIINETKITKQKNLYHDLQNEEKTCYFMKLNTIAMAKDKKDGKPKVHPELEGFNITIDKFGQLHSNMSTEKLNEFLNKNVDDKKLRNLNSEEQPTKKED